MENKQSFKTGALVVDTAGVAEQIPAHRIVQGHYMTIHGDPANTGNIYWGETKAIAELHNCTITPDGSVQVATDNASDVWIDVAVGGERAEYHFEKDNADI